MMRSGASNGRLRRSVDRREDRAGGAYAQGERGNGGEGETAISDETPRGKPEIPAGAAPVPGRFYVCVRLRALGNELGPVDRREVEGRLGTERRKCPELQQNEHGRRRHSNNALHTAATLRDCCQHATARNPL